MQIGGGAPPAVRRVSSMGSMSIWHWIVVIAVVLLLFGRGKISDLMGDVAQGIKAFKKGMSEDETKVDPADPKKIVENNPADPLKQRAQTESKFEA
jgi:sec-independent protein translocase protein TatA